MTVLAASTRSAAPTDPGNRIESKHTSGLAGGSECGSHGQTVRDCLVLCTGVD